MTQVLVKLASATVPGLLLKWGSDGHKALVTYELDGRVSTQWITAEEVLPFVE